MNTLYHNLSNLPWKKKISSLIIFFLLYIILFLSTIFSPYIKNVLIKTYGNFVLDLIFTLTICIFLLKKHELFINNKKPSKNSIIALVLVCVPIILKVLIYLNIPSKNEVTFPPFIFLFGYIFSALSEELLFKGILFPFIFPTTVNDQRSYGQKKIQQKNYSYWIVIIVISALFALIHLTSPLVFISTFIFSLFSFVIFYHWNSLILTSIFHFLWNFLSLQSILKVKPDYFL
jgi:membrane protease YdiL (CAAX protease family)